MMYILVEERVKMYATVHNVNINDIIPKRRDYLLYAIGYSGFQKVPPTCKIR